MDKYKNGHDLVTNFNCKQVMEEESLAEAGGKKQDTDITLYLSGRMNTVCSWLIFCGKQGNV